MTDHPKALPWEYWKEPDFPKHHHHMGEVDSDPDHCKGCCEMTIEYLLEKYRTPSPAREDLASDWAVEELSEVLTAFTRKLSIGGINNVLEARLSRETIEGLRARVAAQRATEEEKRKREEAEKAIDTATDLLDGQHEYDDCHCTATHDKTCLECRRYKPGYRCQVQQAFALLLALIPQEKKSQEKVDG